MSCPGFDPGAPGWVLGQLSWRAEEMKIRDKLAMG